ncbi:FAD-binding oxidoreductase [bacterium M00.F.Ca.ET.152.01.1.1]|nr:FAD-binding oxidoreductase [bacterium M00.F.Ca.ET.152.01.1.1]
MSVVDEHSMNAMAFELAETIGLLVIGAGRSGIAVSLEGARAGLQVVLVDENPVEPSLMGTDVPLAFGQRMTAAVVTAPVPLMRVGIIGGNGLYGRQTLRGNLAYGGGPHEWLSFEEDGHKRRLPTTPLSQFIAKRLQQLYPKLEHIRVIRSWAGIVENTLDGRPVLDKLPYLDNVVVGTMSSVGFGLSPASGRALSELALDGTCSFGDLSSMKLSRFDGLATDWQAAKGWTPPERSHTSTMARVAQRSVKTR